MNADLNLLEEQVVLGSVHSDSGFTHDTLEVTYSATLKQGSLLKADGSEAATADATDVIGAVDDLTIRRHSDDLEVGDTLKISVARRGLVLNRSVLKYSDGAINAAGEAALSAAGNNKIGDVVVDSQVVA